MAKVLSILGCVVVAVASFFAVIAFRANGGGVDVEAFRNSSVLPSFCRAASPLDLSRSHDLTPHKRLHVIEKLRDLAPDGIVGEFDLLLAWYKHPHKDERERSDQASIRIGEFVERSCDEINVGGIRT